MSIGRSHKYIKRTGATGNYRYWYKMPDGSVSAGDDAAQDRGRVEHAKRLIAGRREGKHTLNNAEIARITGHDVVKVANNASNVANRGHDFNEHHMAEASHEDTGSREYSDKVARHHGEIATPEAPAAAPAAPAAPRTPRARASRGVARGRTLEPEGPTASESAPAARPASPARAEAAAARAPKDASRLPGGAIFTSASSEGAQLREAHRRREGAPPITAAGHLASAAPAAAAEETKEQKKARLIKELKEQHGVDLAKPESAPAVKEAARRVETARSAPAEADASDSPLLQQARANRDARAKAPRPSAEEGGAARNLHQADPDFAASEAPVQRMAETSRSGGNPYIDRAKEIFDRVKSQLKPERKAVVEHMLSALGSVTPGADGKYDKAALLAAYKSAAGSTRIRTLPADEFEKGTFITLDEITDNPPVNLEVERMKRGYAAKQLARMKPFVKEGWLAANSNPDGSLRAMPTFGDLKSWDEAGGRPSWAEPRSRIAVPQEVHQAAAKGPDGKPQYPPPWMPIHLMPAWNYIVKKSQGEGANPYGGLKPQVAGSGKIDAGAQATYQEGIAMAALRKYVQMRGGADQLVDIPFNKVSELGTTHADIFKAVKELSDAALKKLITTKIIDPVSLAKLIDEEVKPVKKSFELVVEPEESYIPGETIQKSLVVKKSVTSESNDGLVIDIRKSRIEKIEGILRARRATRS